MSKFNIYDAVKHTVSIVGIDLVKKSLDDILYTLKCNNLADCYRKYNEMIEGLHEQR